MRYTISALATDEKVVQSIFSSLNRANIPNEQVKTMAGGRPHLQARPDAEILVAVTTTRHDQIEQIKSALVAGGGKTILLSEESSALDAIR